MVTINESNRNSDKRKEVHDKFVASAIETGFSRSEAQTIVDLAFHACDEAQRTIGRIATTAEGKGAPACVIILALGLMRRVSDEFAAQAECMEARFEAGETRQ